MLDPDDDDFYEEDDFEDEEYSQYSCTFSLDEVRSFHPFHFVRDWSLQCCTFLVDRKWRRQPKRT